jgi:hypothetical protein
MITLRPGVSLRGGTLRFGAKGVRLTSGNRLEDVTVTVPDHEVAISNDTAVSDFGRLTLRNVRTRGQVLLLADGAVRRGHVDVDGLAVGTLERLDVQAPVTTYGAGARGFNVYDGSLDSARFPVSQLAGGSVLMITGRPGSGKTTLLRTINGELAPSPAQYESSASSSAATATSASTAAGSTAGSLGIVGSWPSDSYRLITRGSM